MFMIKQQQRCHPKIAGFYSAMFYHGEVTSPASLTGVLSSLCQVTPGLMTDHPLILVPTKDMPEGSPSNSRSFQNMGEAMLVTKIVDLWTHHGVRQADILIITPYSAQVDLLTGCLEVNYPSVSVSSVDRAQGEYICLLTEYVVWMSVIGSENIGVIFSAVRSNGESRLGFISDPPRINVAISRAKRCFVLICDERTVSVDPLFRSLVEYIRSNGIVHSPDLLLR